MVWAAVVVAALTGAPAVSAGQAEQAGTSSQAPESPQPQTAPTTLQQQTDASNGTTNGSGAQDNDPFKRFVNSPDVKPMTVKEKGTLAVKNFVDPFNALTILAASGISVAADSHSAYGPGMAGFGRSVGVSFTEDMTGNFFNVFLIPSIVHQDPHYHRWPHATIKRRALHCVLQVFWTRGDTREGMLNYGNLLGDAIDDEIGNLYIPGRRTNAAATAERYGIDLATAPIDNAITEFLPDVARRLHVRVVFIQRIINTVAKTPGTVPASGAQ
jgi:hypothetical protein